MRVIATITVLMMILLSCKSKHSRVYASDEMKFERDDDVVWVTGMKKYVITFNNYREENEIPVLPGNFYLEKFGGDYASWKNPEPDYPALDEKIVVWFGVSDKEPFLVWENNIYKGKNGEILAFRYNRHNPDSLMMNYLSLPALYKKETDSLYGRSYRFFKSEKDSAIHLRREQYDSILSEWRIR